MLTDILVYKILSRVSLMAETAILMLSGTQRLTQITGVLRRQNNEVRTYYPSLVYAFESLCVWLVAHSWVSIFYLVDFLLQDATQIESKAHESEFNFMNSAQYIECFDVNCRCG